MEQGDLTIGLVFIENSESSSRMLRVIHINQMKVIFVDIGYSETQTKKEGSMPKYKSIEDFLYLWDNGDLELTADPFQSFYDEDELEANHESYIDLRDANYKIVSYIWEKKREEFLLPRYRAGCIAETASRYGRSEQGVRWLIKRFLQRGMTKNALLPDYFNCGSKGGNEDYYRKRGRSATKNRNGEVVQGIAVTPRVLTKILKGYEEFYIKGTVDVTKRLAYDQTIMKYFAKKIIEDGESKLVLISGTYPLQDTFYYHVRQNSDKVGEAGRGGKINFDNNVKEKPGNSLTRCSGPGSIFQIDSTSLPVTLVSSLTFCDVIGRAILYYIVDVYSRLICGYHIGLENASYSALMMALVNTIENKTILCQKYGFKDAIWPCAHLPATLVEDNGSEYTGYKSDNMINNLKVKVTNATAYSPTMKAIVESDFKVIKQKLVLLPGNLPRPKKRVDKDVRLYAVLTIEELEKILIANILNHNASVISGYVGDRSVLKYKVNLTPNDLWKHGIQKVTGARKIFDGDLVWENLLPKATARITKKGILFDTRYYTSKETSEQHWNITHKNKELTIGHDPRNVTRIIILLDKGKKRIICSLPPDSPWIDLSQDECRTLRSDRRGQNQYLKHKELEREINIHRLTQEIVVNAKKRGTGKLPKSSLKNIKLNKALEKRYRWSKQTNAVTKGDNYGVEELLKREELDSDFFFINQFKED